MQKNKRKSTYHQRKEARYSPYQNGVKDNSGNIVIRPLTREEIDFLERFNKTEVDASFSEDSPHNVLIEKNKELVAKLKKTVINIKNKIKKLSNSGYLSAKDRSKIKKNKPSRDLKIKELRIKLREMQEQLYELDIKYQINHNNYARREDTMNCASRVYDQFEENNLLSERDTVLDLVDFIKLEKPELEYFIDGEDT